METLDLVQLIGKVYGDPQVKVLLLLTMANAILGIARALAPTNNDQFELGHVADWLRHVVAWLIAYGGLAVVQLASPGLVVGGIGPKEAAFAAIVAALLGKVFENVKGLGLPMPDYLGGQSRLLNNGEPTAPK